ncbi:MAG: gamma-glutamyl-phosphate reductase, partial [Roseibium sp.]
MLEKVESIDVQTVMAEIGQRARAASRVLAVAPTEAKNNALKEMAKAVRVDMTGILQGNAKDLELMRANGQSASFLDRGTLTEERIEAVARALEDIVALEDPVGSVISAWERPNGLKIERV